MKVFYCCHCYILLPLLPRSKSGKYHVHTPEHRIGIHMIAEWLGHSVKVMLEHYGRSQQSDFDNIAKACERVRQEKVQNRENRESNFGLEGVNLDPFFSQNRGLSVENTGPPPHEIPSLNPSLNTAARGGIRGNGVESPFYANSHDTLENKVHEGNKRQEMESCVNRPNYRTGWRGIRTHGGN